MLFSEKELKDIESAAQVLDSMLNKLFKLNLITDNVAIINDKKITCDVSVWDFIGELLDFNNKI